MEDKILDLVPRDILHDMKPRSRLRISSRDTERSQPRDMDTVDRLHTTPRDTEENSYDLESILEGIMKPSPGKPGKYIEFTR